MTQLPDRSGTALGRYRLVRLLGRGGMGEVYEAVDTVKDRTVALKLLPPQLSDDPDYRARFLRESQTAARLADPHVVPIHDFGEIDGHLFLDMRIVRGRDLRALMDDGQLAPERATSILTQIASALDSAHAAGLLHRDVKPENVLVDANDFAYLADFGLVQTAGETRLTATGSAIGSFAYMAPERFGDVPVGPAADTYSLACVLYECLTGAQPFPSTSYEQIIAGHLHAPIPVTGTAFDAVLAGGMAKDPTRRFGSAGAFADAAARVAASAGYPATRVGPSLVPAPPVPPASARPSRLPLAMAGVALLAVVVGGAGVTYALTSGSDASTTPTAAPAASPADQPVVTVTETAESPTAAGTATPPATTVTQPGGRPPGDLGLPTAISSPACDGRTIAVVHNAITPGDYAADVAGALAQFPGTSYLRTDQSCRSLKQSENGNPIYAVYYPGATLAQTCAAKSRVGGPTYARRLDDSTPVGTEIC